MPNTSDYLTQLINEKNSLADKLVAKGVPASHDETFTTLIPKVDNIGGGGYQYPSSWPDIRTNTTDGIVLLVADINPTVCFLVQGGLTSLKISIDWGDGTVETNLPTNATNTYKGASLSRTYLARHTYATQGTEDNYHTYVIKINRTSTGTTVANVGLFLM